MGELKTDITTLTKHLLSQQQSSKEATGDFTILLSSIASACKWISNVVRKAELLKVIGTQGTTNVQNESQQKLDVLSNEIMTNMLIGSGKSAILVSEEDEEAIFIGDKDRGHYCIAFDPLDGSSNIDCAVGVGTIFGIYRVKDPNVKPSLDDILRKGSEMMAAGYCLYGSSTMLVLNLGSTVNGYTLDPNMGEFILTHPEMKIGSKKIYSINEGNASTFDDAVKKYLNTIKFPKDSKSAFTARYVGSMVADIHRTILYGGIFMYPSAKLRILYEGYPMARIIEAAGGKASTGRGRLLDIVPSSIHARCGIFLGSADQIEAIEACYRNDSS